MQIQPSQLTSSQPISLTDGAKQAQERHSAVNVTEQTKVSISDAGKMSQQIDDLIAEIDNLYLSHLTPKQRDELNQSYAKLDELFSQSNPDVELSAAEEKVIDKIDQILSEAEKSFSKEDLKKLDSLDGALDKLFEQELANQDKIFDTLDQLEDSQQQLVMTSLSSQQKEELNRLNSTLDLLFKQQEFSPEDNEKIDQLFKNINSIFDNAYNNLPADKKEKVDELSQTIEQLYQAMEFGE